MNASRPGLRQVPCARGMVAIHSIPENIVQLAMASPFRHDRERWHSRTGKGHPGALLEPSAVHGEIRPVQDQYASCFAVATKKMTWHARRPLPDETGAATGVASADADIAILDPAASLTVPRTAIFPEGRYGDHQWRARCRSRQARRRRLPGQSLRRVNIFMKKTEGAWRRIQRLHDGAVPTCAANRLNT